MDILEGPITQEAPKGPVVPQTQPIAVLSGLDAPLDDNAVREAFMKAAEQNKDPMTATMADLVPAKESPSQPAEQPVQVPQKFLKPDGEVDVEKLQASTKQLEEAVQQKETALKSVKDLVDHYLGLEKKFGSLPNAEKIQTQIPQQVPQTPQQMTDQQLMEMINADMRSNPAATVANLVDIALAKRLQPIEEKERINSVRENVEALAKKDPRILDQRIFNAITSKIESDPDIRRLKNPHRAAWLEVKEELRLGEYQSTQAQPSKTPSPILAGGTPPSAPSSSAQSSPHDILANLDKVDLRDKRQEAEADAAMRAWLSRPR